MKMLFSETGRTTLNNIKIYYKSFCSSFSVPHAFENISNRCKNNAYFAIRIIKTYFYKTSNDNKH